MDILRQNILKADKKNIWKKNRDRVKSDKHAIERSDSFRFNFIFTLENLYYYRASLADAKNFKCVTRIFMRTLENLLSSCKHCGNMISN